MRMLVMPVANGVLPRPDGGRITGMFLLEQGGKLLADVGIGREIVIAPWVVDEESVYPVGVVARIMNMWTESAMTEEQASISVIMAVLEGRGHARLQNMAPLGAHAVTAEAEALHLQRMRKEYPAISGAGWMPEGGYTEFRDASDIPVTIYGTDLESGKPASMTGNLGGLVEMEQAHTLEHAIIRALRVYGLCTARTLSAAVVQEAAELKQSVEFSIRHALPEVLGMTATGVCGNPMTNLAQFYLSEKFVDNIHAGQSLDESLSRARRATMSQLSGDLGLTMNKGLRVMQGLKKGMSHDDTPLKLEKLKRVIGRFPFEPWS